MAYITVQDMRDEGVPLEIPDIVISDRITLAQSVIEQILEQFFEVRSGITLSLNGTGHDLLWLPVPPVSVSSITLIQIDAEDVDSEDYSVVMPDYPDSRRNPKIKKVNGIWPAGVSNITVTGDFGFVDKIDDTPIYDTPSIIKDICKRIVNINLPLLTDVDGQKAKHIIQESVKDYSYRLDDAKRRGKFGDPAIDQGLSMFRKVKMTTL